VKVTELAADLLELLLRILELPDSNLGPESGYPEILFAASVNSSRQTQRQYVKSGHDRFLLHPFQLVFNHAVFRRYMI
jgi:hypothetical protein